METSVWVPSQQSGGALDQSFDSFLTGCLEVAASVVTIQSSHENVERGSGRVATFISSSI